MYYYDSRQVKPGDTFICLPGGEAYIEQAKANGASAIVHMTRAEMAARVHEFYAFPSQKLCVYGVTGTNGKTSVCHFVTEALKSLGRNPLMQGTLTQSLTTPESLDTARSMAEHLEAGGTDFVMEVSSHGIHQGRVLHVEFDVKCLTNITQDHLDYHGSMDAYKQVKYGFMNDGAMPSIFPEDIQAFEMVEHKTLLGRFNQENLRAAALMLCAAGHELKDVKRVLAKVSAPRGRFERVISDAPFAVIVDYAHTPGGLESVLEEACSEARQRGGRVWVCFGCGGDRDRDKRPLMASAVERWSAGCVVTQDNPRHEEPGQIMTDILKGFSDSFFYDVESDRALAIDRVISMAEAGDVVVIAGKGHETYQLVGDEVLAFDDRDQACKALKARGFL